MAATLKRKGCSFIMDNGWIKIHRKIRNHYLFDEKRVFSKFEAWIDILLSCNHSENTFLLGNELTTVEAGSFITSEIKLMKSWGWSKSKVRNFLQLLQNDEMIVQKKDRKKTTIYVVKFRDYQILENEKRPRKDHEKTTKEPRKDTNKNEENILSNTNVLNNINVIEENSSSGSFNFRKALLQENFDPKLVDEWLMVRKKKKAVNTETALKVFLNQVYLAERTKGIDRNEILQMTVSRSWQSFKIEYLENLNKNNYEARQQQGGSVQRRIVEDEILRRSMECD